MLRSVPSRSRTAGAARLPLILGLGLAGLVLAGGVTAAAMSRESGGGGSAAAGSVAAGSAAVATPHAALDGKALATGSTPSVSWRTPLRLTVSGATLQSVAVTGPTGALPGTAGTTGWSAPAPVPATTYRLHAVLVDAAGTAHPLDATVRTSKPSAVLHADVSPGRGGVVGVGQPAVLRLDHAVTSPAARAALVRRLTVTTTPAVAGAWHFFNSYELHYRAEKYWQPGTTVAVRADLAGFRVPGTGTWGGAAPVTSSFRIGDSLVSTVDVSAHTMTVRRNGNVLRTLPVSTGRDKYPTKGGVHVVLSVERVHLYNSATVGIPVDSADGYLEKLPYSMRISNGGAFVHANPATVRYQGHLNVSHGCVNLSVADAKWFYEHSSRGDVVDIVHAVVPPVRTDEGMFDWN